MTHHIYIPGEPRPWKRTGGNGKRRYTDPEMAELKRTIGVIARTKFSQPIQQGVAVSMECCFYVQPPKRLDLIKRPYPTRRPDLDNMEKLVADALNGIAYHDDCQIVDSHTRKVWAINEEPHTSVYVRELTY